MEYKDLKKLFHSDKENYQKIYYSRFESDMSIKLNFDVAGCSAFFVQSEEVLQLMFHILRLDKEVTNLASRLPDNALNQYLSNRLITEIELTNKIEGVHSSKKEINEALTILEEQSKDKGKEVRFFGMVEKYNKLCRHELVDIASPKDIRTIYDELVLPEIISSHGDQPEGELFRTGSASVYDQYDKPIHTGINTEAGIVQAVNQALYFLNNNAIDELYRICLFHYLIEYIHPFYDGNGRLGRFILSYGLSQNSMPLVALSISATIQENKKAYYQAFNICNDPLNKGDLTPFLIMMLEMIEKTELSLIDSLSENLDNLRFFSECAKGIGGEDANQEKLYRILIESALFSVYGIGIKNLEKYFSKSNPTIKKWLSMLEKQGLLITRQVGHTKYYQMNLNKLREFEK